MGKAEQTAGRVDGGSAGRSRLRLRNIVLAVVAALLLVVVWQIVWAMTAKPGPMGDHAGALRAITLRGQGVEVVGQTVSAAEAERIGGQGWGDLAAALASYQNMWEILTNKYGKFAPDELIPAGEYVFPFAWPIDATALWAGTAAPDVLVEQTREGLELIVSTGGLDLLDAAFGARVVARVYETEASDEGDMIPHDRTLSSARGLSMLLVGRMHQAAANHQPEEARLWCGRALQLAAIYTRQGSLIEYLVGNAMAFVVLHAVADLTAAGRLDAATADALLDELNIFAALDGGKELSGLGSIASALRGERALTLQHIDLMHTRSGRVILSEVRKQERVWERFFAGSTSEEPGYMRLLNVTGVVSPSKAQTIRDLDRYYDAMIEPIESREGAARHAGFDQDAFLDELPTTQRILPLLIAPHRNSTGHVLQEFSAIPNILKVWSETRQSIALTRLALAAELYRLRTGEVPVDAGELVGTVLDEPVREPVELWRDPSEGRALTFDDLRSDLAKQLKLPTFGGE